MKKRHSLVWRIALSFGLLLVLVMGGLSLFLSSYFHTSYQELLAQNLRAEAHLVASRLAARLDEDPAGSAMAEIVQTYAESLNVRVTIIDRNGFVLGDSNADFNEMENHLNRPEVQSALRGDITTATRFSNTLKVSMLYTAAPILRGERIEGVARLAISLQSVQDNINRIQRTIISATGVALLVGLLLAFIIASYTTRPIEELTGIVRNFSSGQSPEISTTRRRDEIGQLYQAFQAMSTQLNQQIGELETERGKLEAVLANISDGIVIVDEQGIVQLINPAALLLFRSEADGATGKSLVEVVRQHQLVELWRRSQLSGAQESVTLEISPSRLFVQGIASPMRQVLPGMTLLLFQDLTRVRRLETVRRDFVSNVSHELRTPLASLKALTETLQEGALEDPPAARRFLQRMETEIDNLTQMVHELLELSKIESNRVPLKRRPVSPCEMATPAVERMQMQAERAGLSLRMECPDNFPQVQADPERVTQVLINLIHNAIKFTQPGGEIVVSGSLQGDSVTIYVRDTGVGIPPVALTRIFERFYKADRSRSGGGTGLGLSIARHIIEAHGGRIWAESDVDRGSTFYFTLPVA
jgi:two-component system, OmpR family, phosphate regulon sensor histidine kinase PhoR